MLSSRMGLRGVAIASWTSLALGAESTSLGARVPTSSVLLEYAAVWGCPSETEFRAQLSSRVPIAWHAAGSRLEYRLRVTVESKQTRFMAHLEYVDGSGKAVERSLEASDCFEAVKGMALVTAIAIESEAGRTVVESSDSIVTPASAPAGAQPIPQGGAPAPASADRATLDTRPPRLSQRPVPRERVAVVRWRDGQVTIPANGSAGTRQEFGAQAGLLYGVGATPALGGGLFWGMGRGHFPTLRASTNWYESRKSSTASEPLGSHYRLLFAAVGLCDQARLAVDVQLIGALCAGVELGQYFAEGETTEPKTFRTYDYHLFWAAAQLSTPVRLAGSGVFVELQPVVRFPLVSASFYRGKPEREIFEVPRIAFGLNLATGLAF